MNPLILVLRGVFAFVLGLLLVIWPHAALEIILILFPIFAIIDGLTAIMIGWRTAKEGRWLSFIPMGILEIMIGIFVFLWPNATVTAFVYLLAIWAFVLGLSELLIAINDKQLSPNSRWLFGIGAVITLLLGASVVMYPIVTSLVILWLFGLFFLVYGVLIFGVGMWVSTHLNETVVS